MRGQEKDGSEKEKTGGNGAPETVSRAFGGGSLRRIGAMVLRHFYLIRTSWPRVVELAYWPSIQVILWGFISRHFVAEQGVVAEMLAVLLGAVLLWDFLFRGQLGVSLAYMEEMWSRNLGHLFVSPLREWEWCVSLVVVSFLRASFGLAVAALLALPFYGFSLLDLGLPLIFFFFNLVMMGWWLGLTITSVLMRVGSGAEGLAWATAFLLAPVCAIYYPVSTLPGWLQAVAAVVPGSYVFEGLRALVLEGRFVPALMAQAFALNLLYLALAGLLVTLSFRKARATGALLQTGE